MLVLSRKEAERVEIGDNVVMTIVALRGGKVRVGFEAPPGIKILRGEVAERDRQAAEERQHPSGAAADAAQEP